MVNCRPGWTVCGDQVIPDRDWWRTSGKAQAVSWRSDILAGAAHHDGFEHTLHEYHYGYSLHAAGFCGGSRATANWLSRDDLVGALKHVGYDQIEVGVEQPDHPNGPAVMVLASQSSANAKRPLSG